MSENPQTPPPSPPTSPLDPPPAPAAKAAAAHEHSHSATLTCTIDGQPVTVPHGTTIFDAARLNGIAIPTLCHQQNQTPVAVCRICVVDCGERAYQAACIRECEPDMKIQTGSPGVMAARKTLYELLLADHPSPCIRQQNSGDCELETQAAKAGLGVDHGDFHGLAATRFLKRSVPVLSPDDSSLSIHVDYAACILCDRCVRGCSEIRHNFVIARQGKGYHAAIAFDDNKPMGNSTCVSCGECMVSCPTGALTNKRVLGQNLLQMHPEALSPEVEALLAMPIFKNVSGTFLELNRGAIIQRRIRAGEIIVREGENGSTAFYIVDGKADVYISSPRAHVSNPEQKQGLVGRIASKLLSKKEEKREGESGSRTFIPIDASVDLPYDDPIAELGPGDLFGEMTCMSFYPRSATVRAKTDCVMLEMLRNVLDVLQKNKTFREQLDRNYRTRALRTHLLSVPIFATLDEGFITFLQDRVELVRFAPGQMITEEGADADAFYLVRIGFVKVSQVHNGEELVLAYLPRGGYFGEMGLLALESGLLAGKRNASCTALDHVELVKISAEDFHEMLNRFPEVRRSLEQVARERAAENVAQQRRTERNVPLDSYLAQGLMDAQSLLVLDLEKCTRCDQCVRACADAHDGVTRLLRDGLRFDHFLIATSCRQCKDPLCMVGCPVGSIRRRNSLEVIIEDWCVGCGLCATNCPYGNINLQQIVQENTLSAAPTQKVRKATSCDLCHNLPEPSCVYACPHDAAHRVKPEEFFADFLKSQSAGLQTTGD
jgi:CRP-like cAMP-binding protein/Fe-S-cluster-containing hydrogenase component 2